MKKTFLLLASLMLSIMSTMAQEAIFDRNDITSPEVNADGSVTFRLYSPKAITVKVTGDFLKSGAADLKQDSTGLWTYTSEPLEPEMYSYKYLVNGTEFLDPSNIYRSRDIASFTNIFIVSKDKADKGGLYSVQEVPHGNVAKVWYDSPTLKMQRRMTVYTPAGYDDSKKSYPVLYLFHGAGGDEDAWTTLGRAAQILDNLIAMGKAEPMIVVMPNGNMNAQAAAGEWSKGMYKPSFTQHMNPPSLATMEESFPDIQNYVEKHYRVIKDKKHRAVAGLSMGGGHTFSVSKTYPERFDYIGLFSAAIVAGRNVNFMGVNKQTLDGDAELGRQIEALKKNNPKLYWIAIGNTDFLYNVNKAYREYLDEKGLKYEYFENEGGHIWRLWRIYLSMFAPRLFK
ncbi:MAG: esterase [Bacteroidales bacterium]